MSTGWCAETISAYDCLAATERTVTIQAPWNGSWSGDLRVSAGS